MAGEAAGEERAASDAPPQPTSQAVTLALRAHFGPAVTDSHTFRDQEVASISKDILLDCLRLLRDQHGFDHLSDVTAVDHLGRQPRFDVVYNLFSFEKHIWYRLRVGVKDEEPVPSAIEVFPGANWAEREVYDLFGIVFDGHPQLQRILMPEGWVGYPLRKDYPMSQITLPRSGATKMPE